MESGFGDHLGVRANRGDLKAKSANVGTTKEFPPNALVMNKYGIPMYKGSHIVKNEQIEAIGFDGEF